MGKRGKASLGARAAVAALAAFSGIVAAVIGAALGFTLAETSNVRSREDFDEFNPALPTRILDINGELITEFAADERRELVPLDELPRHLINAVIAREDVDFFNHRGFCVRGTARAAIGVVQRVNRGGGSTITQQVARQLFLDPRERTFRRKAWEIWWALQLERRYSKNEILEIYLNYMIMGPGVFGVEAASRYFFGHSAREATLAESAILAVQLSSPTRHNPLRNPNVAMNRQRFVLDRMVSFGFATREEADASFNDFWDNFDHTRADVGAYLTGTANRAPWFSELVRRELDDLMFGQMDYFRDGFTVHTTLNLRHQEAAERYMAQGLERANRNFRQSRDASIARAERAYMPIIDLLSLKFDLGGVHAASAEQDRRRAVARYTEAVNPVVDVAALMFGIPELREITAAGFDSVRRAAERNIVEGALITLENHTGRITAVVGGSEFGPTNQFIRATQANVQTGSAFKPLYFSAAIDARQVTAGSLIHDVPVVFHNEDGTQYIPINFGGTWRGGILMHRALNVSLNIPAIKVLDSIGFDAAIRRSADLLGITSEAQKRAMFPRVYPLALGITSTSPLRMARAFSVFASEGREVTPIAIRRIEDRNGRVVFDPEGDMLEQKRRRRNIQVVSPQNAYIMSRIMQRTGEGTMANAARHFGTEFRDDEGPFRMPIAGKTGTTQNWADAWIVGYSPYYTTAIWIGFDMPGNSLGQAGTGAGLVGPVWGSYMREIHLGLPRRDFARPATGIAYVTVCSSSGLLATPHCSGTVTLPFLQGTAPGRLCESHGAPEWAPATAAMGNIRSGALAASDGAALGSLAMPALPDDLFLDILDILGLPAAAAQSPAQAAASGAGAQGAAPAPEPASWAMGNPLLDGGGAAPAARSPAPPTPPPVPPPAESAAAEAEALGGEGDPGGAAAAGAAGPGGGAAGIGAGSAGAGLAEEAGSAGEEAGAAEAPRETAAQELALPIGNPFLD